MSADEVLSQYRAGRNEFKILVAAQPRIAAWDAVHTQTPSSSSFNCEPEL